MQAILTCHYWWLIFLTTLWKTSFIILNLPTVFQQPNPTQSVSQSVCYNPSAITFPLKCLWLHRYSVVCNSPEGQNEAFYLGNWHQMIGSYLSWRLGKCGCSSRSYCGIQNRPLDQSKAGILCVFTYLLCIHTPVLLSHCNLLGSTAVKQDECVFPWKWTMISLCRKKMGW